MNCSTSSSYHSPVEHLKRFGAAASRRLAARTVGVGSSCGKIQPLIWIRRAARIVGVMPATVFSTSAGASLLGNGTTYG